MQNNKDPHFRNIVKSVHDLLALPWLENNFDIDIVIIVRNPANIISSYLDLKFPDSIRNIFSQSSLQKNYNIINDLNLENKSLIENMAYQIGFFYYFLEKNKKKNWNIIKHEDLCLNPVSEFKLLYNRLNLKWDNDVLKYIQQNNSKGNGMQTKRLAKKQINKYRKKLSNEKIKEIKHAYNYFDNSLYKGEL